jgi:NifU-like protein involved in Fe-S cluster formation
MLDDLYTKEVLRAAAMISRTGRLDAPQASARRVSPVCGSKITVDLSMQDGAISEYAQDIHACALGQSAASIVARRIIGQTPDQVAEVASTMRAMLSGDGKPPGEVWSDFGILENVRDHKARHGAVLLALEATLDAASQITDVNYEEAAVQLTRKA